MSVFILLSALLAIPAAHAHGTVRQITIGGKAYAGVVPLQDGTPPFTGSSIMRQIYSGGPITDVTSADNACGMQSKLATQVANVNPGDEVQVLWGGETLEPSWPHDVGPMFAYLASCGTQKCSEFDASKAKWFKIAQSGKTGSGWGQMVIHDGKPYTYNLPSNIAPGGYLLRNEVVNLALLDPYEIYPTCAQIMIGGSGTGTPKSSELASMPGTYKASDFLIGNGVYDSSPYTMPGPAISTLAESGSGGNAAVGAAPPASSSMSSTSEEPSMTSAPMSSATKAMVSSSESPMEKASSTATSHPASKTGHCNCQDCKAKRNALRRSLSPVDPADYSGRKSHRVRFGVHAHGRK